MILITGACGYIGSHCVKYFIENNPQAQILALDNLTTGSQQNLIKSENVLFYRADLLDINEIDSIFSNNNIDSVIHFAAYSQVNESMIKPMKYYENNLIGSINLLNTMSKHNVNKIVFSSTCAVYGIPDCERINEDMPVNPISVYGHTKKLIEEIIISLTKVSNLKAVILRYFNASGASIDSTIGEMHEPESHLIPLVFKSLFNDTCVKVYGNDYSTPDGTCIRDYIHIYDLAQAHWQALAKIDTINNYEIFNLGSNNGASVLEIIDKISKIANHKVKYEICDRRIGDPPVLLADYSKASELLGFKPQFSIDDILDSCIRFYSKIYS